MSATPSALPGPARQKLEMLQAANSTPPADNNAPPAGEHVRISREEFNALQANAARAETAETRAQAAEARAADAQARTEELSHRLTQLETNSKAPNDPTPPASSAPGASKPAKLKTPDTTNIQFTDEENEQYGETRSYIERICRLVVAEELNRLLPEIESNLEQVRTTAASASQSVARTAIQAFNADLVKAVPDLKELIKHPQWSAYLDERERYTRATMENLIQMHVNNRDVEGLKEIYDNFRTKYIKPLTNSEGWESGNPDGVTTPPTDGDKPTEKLKLSDRQQASKDYRHGKLSWEKLQEVNKKFDEADKKGLVDYNA